ncbi:flavin reductase family protein [Streptomyces olivochromogenes]|uniref:Flavin-dependent monooxygenase, reductase subunit HsaB n=1 Tax=Streptomyces olivochromogenes TaxID=1963 RepID=A0A250VCA4_STROL|nr:flavin reductase family protein [Streptomyces olivochromogenes]KUN45303.1 oxidase [Streptomyces olivochromogenes]GAX51791.1 flavin-dependent monooxygenase, reductase subunit HsaB [Streptomyces olivochromogenes]
MTQSTVRPGAAATSDDFRSMMAGFPTGVGVVTALDRDGTPRGMTCSSVCSVSVAPPTLLVCLRDQSPTLEAVLESGEFTVNLLHADARAVAELFASGNPDRFTTTPWQRAPDAAGPHLIRDAHTVADCTVALTQRMGDHITVYGQTRRITSLSTRPPLLYGLREFRPWSPS